MPSTASAASLSGLPPAIADALSVPLNSAAIVRRASQPALIPWLVAFAYETANGIKADTKIIEAPHDRAPEPEDLLPADADRIVRAEVYPAAHFATMVECHRAQRRGHYRAYLMWRKARDLGKPVADLIPWLDYDAVAIDEDVERWLKPGIRYAGD